MVQINLRSILRPACKLQLFDCSECAWAHLRNQKLSLRRMSSNYPRKLVRIFAVCSRRLRLISPVSRNVVGRLRGRPTIVFLIFQIKKHGLGLSFRDKSFKMYDIASTVRSGWHTLWRKEQRCPAAKSLAPKIFHLSVSHRKFLANYGVYVCGIGLNIR